MKYNDLAEIRVELDKIDNELVELFARRMELCSNVAEIKIAQKLPLVHSGREQEIIDRLSEGKNEQASEEIAQLYTKIFEISKARQAKMIDQNN